MLKGHTHALILLVLCPALSIAQEAGQDGEPSMASVATTRCYELLRTGEKIGYSKVVWSPSTWEGKKTVHDTTTQVTRSARDMLGLIDVYTTIVTVDLERDDDGSLWWMRVVVDENGRKRVEETRWTGKGYEHTTTLKGEVQEVFVATDQPIVADSEAFIGGRIRNREVKVGQEFELLHLDLRARATNTTRLTVEARETVEVEEGPVETFRIVERDPASGSETTLWVDFDGAYVQASAGRIGHKRVSCETAEDLPSRPPVFSITIPARPTLERIFSADELEVEVHLQGNAMRKLPEFPDSPWSKAGEAQGSDESGWTIPMTLTAYDNPEADVELPLEVDGFERELEPTPLMPCQHPRIVDHAKDIVGDMKSAREAALALSLFVNSVIVRGTPDVGELTALEILDTRQGDCSEHAVLFTTLCRSIGIPTRRCSGYVCIGGEWGAHSWCEIWLGEWVGADPTTNCIGTAARYVFFGYPDQPGSFPGVISDRVSGRMEIVTKRIREGDDDYLLDDPTAHTQWHDDGRRGLHVLAGFELRDVPEDWQVRIMGASLVNISAPGMRANLNARADQGYFDFDRYGGHEVTYAGAPARLNHITRGGGRGQELRYAIHSRRRWVNLQIQLQPKADLPKLLPVLERVLAPSFTETPQAAPPPAEGE